MGIQFAVHTYGYHDAMFYVLNGIKMIMNSDFADAMIKLMAMIATSYYSLRAMATASEGGVGGYFLKTAGMLTLITALLLPKADMLVVDRITGKKEKVDGLPYAFVLPVGTLEAFGAGITSLFEQAFSPATSMPYKDYGLVFGQRLAQESKNWRINNSEFASNMNVFLKRCVVLEAMIGTRFTPAEVFDSEDMLELVTSKAGTFRQVDFRVNTRNTRVNCKEAGAILKNYLQPEYERIYRKYTGSDFALAGSNNGGIVGGFAGGINQILKRNLEVGYVNSLGVNQSASNIMKQNMMINALKDYTNISDKYGYTRADDLQKSNWRIAGELAKEYLPILLNIMKALVYASFIFVVPLMILSGGVSQYLKYCTVVFSLQIWPALNSVLNLFVELYSKVRGASITGGNLTFTNFNGIHESIDTIVLVASSLQFCIPFLSFAIVQGGVGSFVHLASSIQGASAGAASVASGEVTSGNRSFDNISQDTASIGNKSGFKTDFNQLHQEGATQVQRADGSMMKTFADGDSSISSGAGINTSSGTRAVSMETAKNASLNEGITKGLSAIKSDEQHYQESQSAGISTTTDRVSHLAQKQAAGENLNFDTSTEDGRAMQQAVNHAVTLHDRDNYGWSQAAKTSVNAYAKAGISSPMPGVDAGTGVGADASVSADNTISQSLDKDSSVIRDNNTNHNLNTLMRAATNEHYTKDDSIDQSLAQSTKASYDQMQSYGQSISQRKEEVENYNQALQASESRGGTDRRDMYHDLEQNVMKRYGVSQSDAHQMIESNDKRANSVWNEMVQREVQQELAEVKAGRSHIENKANNEAKTFASEYSGKVTNQGQLDLQKQAASEGLDADVMKAKINQTRSGVSDKQKDMTENANNQISAIEHHNKVLEKGMNKKVDEYEKDRIGQGKVARAAGKALGSIPLTDLGSNIGCMNSRQKSEEYLKGGEKAPQTTNTRDSKNNGNK